MNEKQCRAIVWERSDGLCERCGRQGHTMHHRKKRSQGGAWIPENIVLVCGDGVNGCHGWIEHNPNAAHAEGFHMRPWEEAEPIFLHQTFWVQLACSRPEYHYLNSELQETPWDFQP